jgi:hypothetical protein
VNSNGAYSQEMEYKEGSLRAAVALAINQTDEAAGYGILYAFGWQSSLGKKRKLRINPNLMIGEFSSLILENRRQSYYRTTELSLYIHYDLIRYKRISLVISSGGFVYYTRGILGSIYYPTYQFKQSGFFYTINAAAGVSGGLRYDPKNSFVAFEIKPFNINLANRFFLSYLSVGLDLKFKKKSYH